VEPTRADGELSARARVTPFEDRPERLGLHHSLEPQLAGKRADPSADRFTAA
jgi:hypothetical protein